MKKTVLLIFSLIIPILLYSCNTRTELTAYVGDGMKDPVLEIYDKFKTQYPEILIEFIFSGSGILAQTISELKSGDIYIPGCLDFLNEVESSQYILVKKALVYHVPSIIVRSDDTTIKSLSDLTQPGVRIGIASPEQAASGRMAAQVIEVSDFSSGLTANVAAYSSDLRTTLELLVNDDVDASISWAESVFYFPDKLKALPIENENVEIPEVWGSVLVFSEYPDASKLFLDYLGTDESLEIFENHAFPRINED